MTSLSTPDRRALAHLARPSSLPVASNVAIRVAYTLFLWSQRRRTRASLRHMTDQMLLDVGISPAEAYAECQKWFWRP